MGISIMYHANLTKPIGEIAPNNIYMADIDNSIEPSKLSLQIAELNDSTILLEQELFHLQNLPIPTPLIAGGGYEHVEENGGLSSGKRYSCVTWGEAICTNTIYGKGNHSLTCPADYTKFKTGNYEKNPLATYDVQEWFLCVKQ